MPSANITDFGAVGDGVTNDAKAFADFNTWGRAQVGTVTLTIPAGTYPFDPTFNGDAAPYRDANNKQWARGIPVLRVVGIGLPHITGDFELGAFTFPTTNQCSARIASAQAGDTTLRLLDPASDAAKFVAGRTITQSDGVVYVFGSWIHVTAFDLISFGDPSHWYREFRRIVSLNIITGVITLDAPLTRDYKSTFPVFNAGGPPGPSSGTDCGGAATIYALDQSWGDCDIQYGGVQFSRAGNQIKAPGKKVVFVGCKCNTAEGIIPSVNQTWIADNLDQSACSIEMDKSIDDVIYRNTSPISQLAIQSASVERVNISNTSIGVLNGTAKRMFLKDSAIGTVFIGATGYGRTNEFIAQNTSFTSIIPSGVAEPDVTNPTNGWTLNNGVIRRAKSFSAVRWAVPGTFMTFKGQTDSNTGFTVVDVVEDGTYTYVQTTIVGSSWPDIPLGAGGTRLDLVAWPTVIACFTNCTGCADAVDYSNPGAFGRPLNTYSKRAYDGSSQTPQGPTIWGYLQTVSINVSQRYTGAGPLTLGVFGQFSTEIVDLTVKGVRTLTVGGTSGAQGGDTIAALGTLWAGGRASPFFSADVSGQSAGLRPIVEIEITANLGITEKQAIRMVNV